MYSIFLIICNILPTLSAEAENKIPLERPHWQILTYNEIPANVVNFKNNQMKIQVKSSSAPVLFPFDKPQQIESLFIKAKIDGRLKLKKGKQGAKGHDDFLLRIGFVFLGEKTLNFFERLIAARWIVKLHSLAPEDIGIDRVSFYNVYSDQSLSGKSRKHPMSDLLHEKFAIPYPKNGVINQKITLPKNSPKTLAIWLGSDGDDTDSSFNVIIKQITYLSR